MNIVQIGRILRIACIEDEVFKRKLVKIGLGELILKINSENGYFKKYDDNYYKVQIDKFLNHVDIEVSGNCEEIINYANEMLIASKVINSRRYIRIDCEKIVNSFLNYRGFGASTYIKNMLIKFVEILYRQKFLTKK